jgi:outer membrane receptor protein involved in Fe transport
MNPDTRFDLRRRAWACAFSALAFVPVGFAQLAAPPDPATLAKYDTNKNGRLDPAEIAAMPEAERPKAVVAAVAEETVEMSPFEVRANERGYYAANTMSGTRLNAKLEDLASSISVITKEQMADFALLDANDIFLYETGTEGTGNYTSFEFDRNGYPMDNTTLEPGSSNRIRGISAANTARGNFETSGRVPLDPINIDSVEISRGPNANIFGLGNAGGTVNVVPASANLTRDRSQVQVRADSFEGYRSSVDLNRVLLKNTLAVRGSAVFQHDDYQRKPTGTNTVRLNGMLRYRPFKSTTLSTSFESYRIAGNRPNMTMPRDTLTAWKAAGMPTYNNKSRQMRFNGVLTGAALGVSTLPTYLFNTTGSGRTNSLMLVDHDGSILFWGQPEGTVSLVPPNPGARNQSFVGGQANTNSPVELVYGLATVGLFNDFSVTDRKVYDWTSINLAAMNHLSESTRTATVGLDHVFFDTPRQMLAFQLGYFREDSDKYRRDLAGGPTSQRAVGALYVDVNEFLPDGRANPNLLRPYIGLWIPTSYENPMLRQIYRAHLAYRLDLTKEPGFARWLGLHQLSAYAEYKDNVVRRLSYKDSIVSNHAWIAAGTQRATTAGAITNNYFRFYVGDNVGQNVDYGPSSFKWGQYPYRWGTVEALSTTGAVTTPGNITNETATLGPAVQAGGGGSNNHQIIKTAGAILQSYLLTNRVVTAFGLRKDKNYNRGGKPLVFLADGANIDLAVYNAWADGDWSFGEGTTKTAGIVVRPQRWLNLYANRSDSFLPAEAATNLLLQSLPDPGGKGNDYGFALNLFGGKLVARFNQYETKQLRTRNGQSATLATRVRGLDFDTPNRTTTPFFLIPVATGWVQRANPTWTAAQVSAEVARRVRLDPDFIARQSGENLAETEDAVSKGNEIEVFYAPSNHWTVKFNLTRQESINAKVAPGITDYVALRMPVWQSIIDPETGQPWWTTDYDPTPTVRTAEAFYRDSVAAPVKIQQAGEGKSRPQIRKYRANLLTSYRLAGVTDHRILKNVQVGGATRWEDKGAIGYFGVQKLPTPITDLDINRPIYDKSHLYLDAFATYRTRLFSRKIGATFQLNVRNVLEDGHLQPIKANPDGSPSVYRIVDPRQFILTATFDL